MSTEALSVPIAAVVPQRSPFLLVDAIVGEEPGALTCRARVSAASAFMEGGRVPSTVAIEYMAQAVAAFVGLEHRRAGRAQRAGLLVGVRDASFAVDGFDGGDELLVRVERTGGGGHGAAFRCDVARDGVPVSSASLLVYEEPLP